MAENHLIREQKRKVIWERTEQLVNEAKAVGISMLEFQEQVIQLYGTGDKGGEEDD